MEPDGLKRVCEYPGRETAGPSTAIPRFLRPGEAHCRSLGYARDDKGRVITHLKVCESDREFFLASRRVEYKVSNRTLLVIPRACDLIPLSFKATRMEHCFATVGLLSGN
jgi:hypothetical protein